MARKGGLAEELREDGLAAVFGYESRSGRVLGGVTVKLGDVDGAIGVNGQRAAPGKVAHVEGVAVGGVAG